MNNLVICTNAPMEGPPFHGLKFTAKGGGLIKGLLIHGWSYWVIQVPLRFMVRSSQIKQGSKGPFRVFSTPVHSHSRSHLHSHTEDCIGPQCSNCFPVLQTRGRLVLCSARRFWQHCTSCSQVSVTLFGGMYLLCMSFHLQNKERTAYSSFRRGSSS